MDLISKTPLKPEDHVPSILEVEQGVINTQRDYRVTLLEKASSLGCYDIRASPLLNISRRYTIPMVMFEGAVSKDWLVLSIRTPQSGRVLVSGCNKLPSASVVITTGGQETRGQLAPHVEHYSITIHKSLLQDSNMLLSTPDDTLTRPGAYPLEPGKYLYYLNKLAQILYTKLSNEEFQLEAIDLALSIISDTGSFDTDRTNRTNRERCVDRAIEFIVSTDQRLMLTDLAEASYCSLRTLDYSFTSVLAMTPKQFLDRYMLNRVRHAIINEQDHKIESIAYGLGYSHLGHMSKSYRSLFGELPSATRKSISLKPRPEHKANQTSLSPRPSQPDTTTEDTNTIRDTS